MRTVAASCLLGAAIAQVPKQDPPAAKPPAVFGQEPEPAQPSRAREAPGLDRQPRERFETVWSRLRQGQPFQGFPVFPSKLSTYGAYPQPSAPGQLPFFPTLPPNEPEVANWPSWVRLRERTPLPFTPETVLLVRNADRVWWRKKPDAAFVPLFFHDKLEAIGAGAEVQVRQAGEFELLLHDSGRLVAIGPTEIAIRTSDPTRVTLEVRSFTRLRVSGDRREHALVLPDGSTLLLPPAAEDTEAPGPSLVLLTRVDEPGWFGGRATLFNAGPRDVSLGGPLGTTAVPPGHRSTIFLRQTASPVPAALDAGDAIAKRDGPSILLQDADGGAVSWSGARFELPAGRTLRFVPIQGSPFDPPAEPPSPATTPDGERRP